MLRLFWKLRLQTPIMESAQIFELESPH